MLGNFGCGQFPKSGYVNVDIDPRARADIFHDLSVVPYPFDTASFSRIEMHHVLEHLPNPIPVMKELHRLLQDLHECLHLFVRHPGVGIEVHHHLVQFIAGDEAVPFSRIAHGAAAPDRARSLLLSRDC